MLLQENKNLEMSGKYEVGDVVVYCIGPGYPENTGIIEDGRFHEDTQTYRYKIKDRLFWILESDIIKVLSSSPSRKQTYGGNNSRR